MMHSYTTGRNFLEAALSTTPREFNRNYLNPSHKRQRDESPLFGVVRRVPYPRMRVHDEYVPWTGNIRSYGLYIKDVLKSHLIGKLSDGTDALFLHSGGYDSRIISCCMAELRDAGYYMGHVHFRCHAPEQDPFLEIMRIQRWPESQYSVWDDQAHDTYDIGRWDDPGTSAWLPITLQLNVWRDIVPDESKVLVITGAGGGEVFNYPITKKRFNTHDYCKNPVLNRWMQYFRDGNDWIGDYDAKFKEAVSPFYSPAFVQAAGRAPVEFFYMIDGMDAIRYNILRECDYKTAHVAYGRHNYQWRISPKRGDEMWARFEASRFRHEHGLDPNAIVNHAIEQPAGWASRVWRFAALWEKLTQS